MAEIDIERKRKRNGWPWALGVLLLLVVAGIGWYFVAGPGAGGALGPDEEPVETFPVEPDGGIGTGATPPPGGAVPPRP